LSRAAHGATAIGVILVCAVAAGSARAGDRLAVVVTVPGDPALSDQLTEVALAALAEHSARDLIGLPELRPRLTDIGPDEDIARCLSTPMCLSRVGRVAGASAAVAGSARREGAGFALQLARIDLEHGGRVTATSPLITAADAAGLMAGVRRAAPPLLVAASIPEPTPDVLVGTAPATTPVADPHARARSTATWVTGGAAVLAVTAFSAAIVTGVVARRYPEGAERADAQQDLARRERYATASTWLWVAGGVFSGTAVAAYTWRLRLP
jgi:hypothetical protein